MKKNIDLDGDHGKLSAASEYIDIVVDTAHRVGREYIETAAQLPIFETSQDIDRASDIAVNFLTEHLR